MHIIRRERYYAILGKPYTDYYRVPNKEGIKFPYSTTMYFLDLSGQGVCVYNSIEDIFLVPKKYLHIIPQLSTESLTFENWKITRIGQEKPYLRNEYKRTWWPNVFEGQNFKIISGEYIVEDEVYGDKYQVNIKLISDSWYYNYQPLIWYPEKISLPLNSPRLINLDKFFYIIFNEAGQEFKTSNNSSEQVPDMV